jgi:hypothetical protein
MTLMELLGSPGGQRRMDNILVFRKKPDYMLRTLGWSGLAVGVAAVGLFVGRELRLRYKFNHRSPYDIFSHAGDHEPLDSYAVGV